LINKKIGNILMRSPFSPEYKRSAIAIQSPDRPGMVSIYVKGAPELLVELCAKVISRNDDRTLELGPGERAEINSHINKMAKQALRVIGFAFIELTYEQWQ
jgi:Ca2+-transporting ATPase